MENLLIIIIILLLITNCNIIRKCANTATKKIKMCFYKLNDNTKNKDNSQINKINVLWFHTETCPHCKNMKNDWELLEKKYKSNSLVKLTPIDIGKVNPSDMLKIEPNVLSGWVQR